MRIVTSRYYANRLRNAYSRLPWHFRNEVRNLGYLDLRPCYDSRRFRLSQWLGFEDGDSFYDDVKALRYSEADDRYVAAQWEARFDPWEEKRRPTVGEPLFHSRVANERYVESMIDYIIDHYPRRDSVQVVRPPYGGRPLVCVVNGGNVTIIDQ